MKFTVVLTAEFLPVAREILAKEFDVVEHPTEADRSEDDLITILSEADAAITLLTDPLTRRVLEANPNLRIIANHAVGYNNIDIDAARELGITVTNTPGVLTQATADFTMALMLAMTRRLVEGEREVRGAGRVLWAPMHMLGSSLQGKRLGIIGMGRIGRAVAARAAAFGMEVTGVHRGDSIDNLLTTSDIISIHTPLTAETRHMIDPQRMKRGAYLVNTSRGAVIDENALCDALESGHLAGAAIDVYEFEPKVNPRLLTMKNVVLTPHIASATVEARGAMARIAATDVYRALKGEQPLHRVV
jgi:glyoxylate reductase